MKRETDRQADSDPFRFFPDDATYLFTYSVRILFCFETVGLTDGSL